MNWESPLFWPAHLKGNTLFVLDETMIPKRMHYMKVKNTRDAVKVIRDMKTRAFGQFLVVLNTFLLEISAVGAPRQRRGARQNDLFERLQDTAQSLNASRPTFPFSEVTGMVLSWAKKAEEQNVGAHGRAPRQEQLSKNILGFLEGIRYRRLERVKQISEKIKDGDSVLTHCNVSGELAMAASLCKAKKKKVRYFVTETRPYFQGAKLTVWELQKASVDVTLVPDNAVGYLMNRRMVNKVIVGSDRSCANGDFANKIGTYQIAVLANEFEIPFYALTQPSNKIANGNDIPIEIRNPDEILKFEGKSFLPEGVKGFYPGFDVIPHQLLTEAIALDVH